MTPSFWPALAKGVMPAVEHIGAIKRLAPRTLIDIGANKGQFSLMARYLFPSIEIQAFEPLDRELQIYRSLIGRRAQLHATALGDVTGSANFFVTARADSSSLLEPDLGQEKAYGIRTKASMLVPVARLPEIIDVETFKRPILMKLDVQGAELEVLMGAEQILRFIDAIYCEVSFVELYKGQPRATEIIQYLAQRQFELRGVFNMSTTKEYGPTQADLLFLPRVEVGQGP